MNKLLTAAALAIASVSATPAFAADIVVDLGTGFGSADFGNSSDFPGTINDTYTFTVVAGTTSAFVGSFALGSALDVVLTSVKLDNTLFTQGSTGALELWTLPATSIAAGTHTITVQGVWGAQGGSYAGTVNFAPAAAVPEPTSWALMIGGFGLVGGTMRRRSTARVACAA